MNFSSLKSLTIPEGSVKRITQDGTVLWEKVMGRIPSEYQEVAWIGTDGKSYFISNFTINNLNEFTLYYTCSIPSNGMHMFGSDKDKAIQIDGSPRFLHRHGAFVYNRDEGLGNVLNYNVFIGDDVFHNYIIECKHQERVIMLRDGNRVLKDKFYNAKCFAPFGVFCNNYNSNPTGYLAANGSKLSEFRFVDDTTGNDVFNPIPCYRKSDNAIGMYDIISKTFFTSEGTASFTKGPDV